MIMADGLHAPTPGFVRCRLFDDPRITLHSVDAAAWGSGDGDAQCAIRERLRQQFGDTFHLYYADGTHLGMLHGDRWLPSSAA
jgi:hypothetical protein